MTLKEMSQRAPRWWSQTDLGLNFNIAPCYGLGKVTSLSPRGLLCEGGMKKKKKIHMETPPPGVMGSAAQASE